MNPYDKPLAIDLVVRVFFNNELHSEDRHSAPNPEALAELVNTWAEAHKGLAEAGPVMIELEFLDEPDRNLRFFRFGTDPRRMVLPIPVSEA